MRKLGLFWFAAALLGAALIFAGCETEADEKIVYLQGEMIHLDVVVENVEDLTKALLVTDDLAIGFTGSAAAGTLATGLTVGAGKLVYILNGGELVTSGQNLTVEGIVYVGIGGKLDVSAGKVIVDGGQVSVLPAKSVAAITDGVPPGALVIASETSVVDGATPANSALGTDKVWIGGALELSDPTYALITTAFFYVQLGGTVKVGTASSVAAAVTVPVGQSLNVAAALTLAAGAELVANGTVNVTSPGSLILTGTAGTAVAKISGAGGVKAGATTITGEWQLAGTAGTVAIAATSGTASSITGAATNAFTAGTGGLITQGAVGSNSLTIGANTTIDLKGTPSDLLGKIVLIAGTNPGKLSLTNSSKILIGAGSGGTAAGTIAAITIGGKSVTSGGFLVADYQVVTASGKLVQIGGTTAGSIAAGTTPNDDVPIASDSAFLGS